MRASGTKSRSARPGSPAAAAPAFDFLQYDGHPSPLLQLIEFLPDIAFFVKNRNSEFVYANARFVRMMGVPRIEDLLGRTDFDFSPRDLAQAFVRDDQTVLRTGRPIVNKVELVPNEDGAIRWHVTSKVPLRDGRGSTGGLAGFTRDLNRAGASLRRYRALAPVTDYIERHVGEPVRVSDLAAVAHLSVSQFERLFRRIFHMAPMQYVAKVRINQACRMLARTDAKLTEVAMACGFFDHSHLTRQFTRAVGLPPGAFRRQRAAE